MDWNGVGAWLKQNAGGGVALIGSLLTGNVPAAVAAGIGLIGTATGTTDPNLALQALQTDPAVMIKLKELANANEADIRRHVERMEELRLQDAASEQKEQQETIRTGDTSTDPYVRQTRPKIARQSWYGGLLYVLATTIMQSVWSLGTGPDIYVLLVILAPCLSYFGFRTGDKFATALGIRGTKK